MMESVDAPTLTFEHPYPRYGLAVALVEAEEQEADFLAGPPARWLSAAREVIAHGLQRFRVHTSGDLEADLVLKFRWLSNEELEESGQKAEDGYYIGPHVVIDDRNARYLIGEARSALDELGDPDALDLDRSVKMKRSFAPFTSKLNQGTKSLSEPKSTKLEAVFSLVAALTPRKPAAQVDFTNQAMIPDLELSDMVRFVRFFRSMQGKEVSSMIRERKEGSKRKRPPLFDGNYPDAPRSSAFGPVGLMGAMGQWAKRAGRLDEAAPLLEKMAGRPIYLVSYDSGLMRQEFMGHHAARLAEEHDLPAVIDSLYRARFHKESDNRPDSSNRKSFLRMASRFLQLYTRPAFRDFLAFRVEYDPIFSPILTDYFMSQQKIDVDIVQSARAYGAYLNGVAFQIARQEVESNEKKKGGGTGRNIYDAKTRALAQLESTALSARRPSDLFARLNVDAGRQSNRDVPADAERFLEATNTGEIDFDVAKDLVLAYMRLRSDSSSNATASTDGEASEVDASEVDEDGYTMD